MRNPSAQAMEDERMAYDKWNRLADIEEKYLRQKAKLFWLKSGDQNTKAFFNAIRIRAMKNKISEVVVPDGSRVSGAEGIKEEAIRHFKEFLNQKPPDYKAWEKTELEEIIGFKCDAADKLLLEHDVSEEEIRRVLFAMPKDKSPGPDGFTTEFFRETWPLIGKDVQVAVQSFFRFGFLPKGINSTILALIPKKKEAISMKDYRPIACCNVLYKIISKILANRLKIILPKVITPNQSAFVKDRLLMENLLLATELVKDYHKENIKARCAMKIDISKAFDSVQWEFLLTSLKAMDFPEKFIHWINLCISTASFSVQVNGELAGYFGSTRGLRQGCPLSPYLFVICMNVLSKKLDIAAQGKKIGYHPGCQSMNLTHLCFADDLMVFIEGDKRSVVGTLEVFNDFAVHSGLHISLEKSTVYMAGITEELKQEILREFPFAYGFLPVRYLGLPLLTRKMTISDFSPLIEKIRLQINSWTARHLSFGGRLQLLRSVVFSLTNFWMAAFRLPKACIKEIDKLCAAFLWSGTTLDSRKAKVSWAVVCTPKEEGGIGIKSLEEVNKVCVLKLIWRLLTQNSLWVTWCTRFMKKSGSFWAVKESSTMGSWIWKKMLKYRELAKRFYKVEIKSGNQVSFWHDSWSSIGCLFDTLGPRGCIDLGISINASLGTVLNGDRRKHRRNRLLDQIEEAIATEKNKRVHDEADTILWRGKNDAYKPCFSSKVTWELMRTPQPLWEPHQGIWFTYATPKFAFLTWLAAKNRLPTGDRMEKWSANAQTSCVLCNDPRETREHLFFACSYSTQVWDGLARGCLGANFTNHWSDTLDRISHPNQNATVTFITRYVFQATIYSIWRERNNRRHGEKPALASQLIKMIDTIVRNRLSTMKRNGVKKYEDGLRTWFAMR